MSELDLGLEKAREPEPKKKAKKKKAQMTVEEQLKAAEEQKEKALERYNKQVAMIQSQGKFGGKNEIARQKLTIGASAWKLAQTDPVAKKALLTLIHKFAPEDQQKLELYVKALG